MDKKNSVIVTGGAGLLGSSLVHQLLEKETEQVTVMDVNPDPVRLQDIAGEVEYIVGDIADPGLLQKTISSLRPRTIYHLGAFLGDACEKNPEEATRININGFQTLLEQCRQHGVEQLLFSSSLGTFGYDLADDENFTDTTLQRPFSYYGVTKLYAETAGLFYKRKYGLDFRGIRYPAIVGPGVRAGGIVTYISAIIEMSYKGEGYTVRVSPETRVAMVHVEDAGRSLIQLARVPMERIRMTNYLINGVAGTPSAAELVEQVRQRIPGSRIEFKPDPDWSAIIKLSGRPVDDSCARQEWDWNPRFDSFAKIMESYLTALEEKT